MAFKHSMEVVCTIRCKEWFERNGNLSGRILPGMCSHCKRVQGLYTVKSYDTVIAETCTECGHLWENTTKYSNTTNYHQKLVRQAFPVVSGCTTLSNVPRGTQSLHSREEV